MVLSHHTSSTVIPSTFKERVNLAIKTKSIVLLEGSMKLGVDVPKIDDDDDDDMIRGHQAKYEKRYNTRKEEVRKEEEKRRKEEEARRIKERRLEVEKELAELKAQQQKDKEPVAGSSRKRIAAPSKAKPAAKRQRISGNVSSIEPSPEPPFSKPRGTAKEQPVPGMKPGDFYPKPCGRCANANADCKAQEPVQNACARCRRIRQHCSFCGDDKPTLRGRNREQMEVDLSEEDEPISPNLRRSTRTQPNDDPNTHLILDALDRSTDKICKEISKLTHAIIDHGVYANWLS